MIAENQSAFLFNRLITDNVLMGFELVHSMKNKKTGKDGYVAMKLNMSKAFDKVEWSFLEEVMLKMGFCISWVNLIMRCLKTVSFSFLINGEISGHVILQQGLRQDDPLSPYLFLICAEGLSCLLHHKQQANNIHGLSMAQHAPPITYLLFADDSLLFCKANTTSCRTIKKILDTYSQAFGQLINFQISALCFSPNIPIYIRRFFQLRLQMTICECHE